ncbi:conserved hypothetical protein [Ricinus communis]|uniref:Uncharacterized protein n=1 Tax=Ricinus communis TaxID=3988 RepID=B9SA93_RICCO|nr:conserved hypothetical protein [Ricinus communis]
MEIDPPQPPPHRRMPRKPAKNRKPEEHELISGTKLSRKGMMMTCQACYEVRHNMKTCKMLKERNASQGTTSRFELPEEQQQ